MPEGYVLIKGAFHFHLLRERFDGKIGPHWRGHPIRTSLAPKDVGIGDRNFFFFFPLQSLYSLPASEATLSGTATVEQTDSTTLNVMVSKSLHFCQHRLLFR